MSKPVIEVENKSWHSSSTVQDRAITVGFTEAHGMAHEASLAPPKGVRYEFLRSVPRQYSLVRSPILGFMQRYEDQEADIVEAIISPAITDRPWVYSLACFQEAMAFSLLGVPVPKALRRRYLETCVLRDNLKRIVFWSQFGMQSLVSYGGIKNHRLIEKCTFVYPAVREALGARHLQPTAGFRLLFSGDFFRKGGIHVVDGFEILQKDFPEAQLRLCCDERIDFNTPNQRLRDEYLAKICRNPAITFGRVSRREMLETVLPQTDVYLLPTYDEAFGFAILEAMSFGIPVVATSVSAIPELIEHNVNGVLIDIGAYDVTSICKGYVVQRIPEDFKRDLTGSVTSVLQALAASVALRSRIGEAARETVRMRFSFDRRNREMARIYAEALA